MVAKSEFFDLVKAELLPLFEHHQFRPVPDWDGFFYRQRGPFLDYFAVGTDRAGEFAHLVACLWVPWMDPGTPDRSEILPEMLGVRVGGEVSPRALRDTWGWEVGDIEQAKASLRGMASAISSFAFPWFDSITTGSAFIDECTRNPGYWRKVARIDRERIREAIDQALTGELQVGVYAFAGKRSRKTKATPEPQRGKPGGAKYEEVSFEHASDAHPELKLSIKGLKKKRSNG